MCRHILSKAVPNSALQAMPSPPGAASKLQEVVEGKEWNWAQQEEKILALWDELNAFEEQLKRTEGKPEFVFFDGPPFATGLPHYGHILAGTLKVRPDERLRRSPAARAPVQVPKAAKAAARTTCRCRRRRLCCFSRRASARGDIRAPARGSFCTQYSR